MTVWSMFISSSALAHIAEPSGGWTGIFLHPFTGPDHLLMLVFLGVGVVYFIRKYRRSGE
jgi:hydrogenase/urease accessory protein HupE